MLTYEPPHGSSGRAYLPNVVHVRSFLGSRRAILQFTTQPPRAIRHSFVSGPRGHADGIGRFFNRQAREDAHVDDLDLSCVVRGETIEDVVERQLSAISSPQRSAVRVQLSDVPTVRRLADGDTALEPEADVYNHIQIMSIRNIQITVDEEMLREVDRLAEPLGLKRSEIVRRALRLWLQRRAIERFEEDWIKALHDRPDDPHRADDWRPVQTWSRK